MKQTSIAIVFSAIFFAILQSCSGDATKIESGYHIKCESLQIKSLNIEEVLKPIDICMNDKYLCILNEMSENEDQIFVFDADNLDFLYKFAKKGNGPEETLALDMVKTFRGDTIYLIDQANYKILSYLLCKDEAKLLNINHLSIPSMGPLQETYWVNDSILIFNNNNGDLITYNNIQNYIVDQVNIGSILYDLPADAINKVGSFHFSVQGKDIYIGLRFFNELFKFEISDSYHIQIPETIKISAKGIDFDNIFNNTSYYSYVDANNKYLLTQYYGYKLLKLQPFPRNMGGRIFKYDLLIFDHNLNILHDYRVNIDILRAFLDVNRNRIYLLEPNEDFDELKYIDF